MIFIDFNYFYEFRALKNWFRQCARTVVKMMKPVEWTTPLGLPVMQPYMKSEKKLDFLCNFPISHKQVKIMIFSINLNVFVG